MRLLCRIPIRIVAFQSCVECDDILSLAAVDGVLANCSACYDEAMQEGLFCPSSSRAACCGSVSMSIGGCPWGQLLGCFKVCSGSKRTSPQLRSETASAQRAAVVQRA
jgi:hypothetical protein